MAAFVVHAWPTLEVSVGRSKSHIQLDSYNVEKSFDYQCYDFQLIPTVPVAVILSSRIRFFSSLSDQNIHLGTNLAVLFPRSVPQVFPADSRWLQSFF